MIKWIKNLLGRNEVNHPVQQQTKTEIRPVYVMADDEMERELVSRVWNSGKPMVAHRNDDGEIEFKEL